MHGSAKRKQNTEEFKAKRREYMRRWMLKKNASPEWRRRHLERKRIAAAQERDDPERNARLIAKAAQLFEEIKSSPERKKQYDAHNNAYNRARLAAMTDLQKAQYRAKAKLHKARRRSKATMHAKPDTIMGAISKAVPQTLPQHVRDDLIGNLCLAVLEGKLLIENIKAEAGKYLKAFNRESETFKTLSLDAEISGTKTRYIDNIASDAEHF